MKELIDRLRNSKDAYVERLQNILLVYEKYPESLFCVYEGDDAKYYDIRIELIAEIEDRHTVPCKGKDDVLRLHERLVKDPKFDQAKLAFFIDRDFDEYKGYEASKKLYMTPCYSIENLYVSEKVFNKILRIEFKIHKLSDNSEYEKVIELYRHRLVDFINATSLLNAWIALQREHQKDDSRLNLSNKNVEDFVKIQLDSVVANYDLKKLNEAFPRASKFTQAQVSTKEKTFHQEHKVMLFRGKYLIDFLRSFLVLLKDDANNKEPEILSSKRKVSVNISKKNIISEASQYAETPECLKAFLISLKSS